MAGPSARWYLFRMVRKGGRVRALELVAVVGFGGAAVVVASAGFPWGALFLGFASGCSFAVVVRA